MRSLAENQDVAGLHKMPIGVEGFDVFTGGGPPRNRTSLIFGGPGGGKTVFALQTLGKPLERPTQRACKSAKRVDSAKISAAVASTR
jgi:RecA/RadA recombinase